jgi:hypothetical protein
MTEQEMTAKIEEINAKNNKTIADLQVENDRKLKGYASDAAFNDYKAQMQKRFDETELELAKLKSIKLQAPEIGRAHV